MQFSLHKASRVDQDPNLVGFLINFARYFMENCDYTIYKYKICTVKFALVALQILGRKFYKNTKKSSLHSQNRLNFIQRTPVVKRHPITRQIRNLLWPMSTPTRNTVYFNMSSSFIYTLKIHRRSFNHSVR